MKRYLLCSIALVCIWPHTSQACGVPNATGPSGVTQMCRYTPSSAPHTEGRDPHDPRFRLAAGYGYSHTIIDFSGPQVEIERHLITATLEYEANERTSLSLNLGAVLGGYTNRATPGFVQPGFIAAVSASYALLTPAPHRPFVILTGTFSFAMHDIKLVSQREQMTSLDARGGATLGYTFFGHFTPYALIRVFGGPVFYHIDARNVVGTDYSHVQLGAGAVVNLSTRWDLFFEGVPLGEQALSGGVAVRI